MNVVIVYKWARSAAGAVVRADGSVDWRGAKMVAGEDDPAALAVAKQIGGSLTGLTVGDGDTSWALARGVEQAFSVEGVPSRADNGATAAVLAEAVRRIGSVDVVVVGDSRTDPGVAVALAGRLGWSAVVGVSSAETTGDGLVVGRRDGARRESLGLDLPVVLGVAAESDTDRAPGMKELLAARKRPVAKLSLSDLGGIADDPAVIGTRRPETTPARIFTGEPAVVAAQLVAALRAEGVL